MRRFIEERERAIDAMLAKAVDRPTRAMLAHVLVIDAANVDAIEAPFGRGRSTMARLAAMAMNGPFRIPAPSDKVPFPEDATPEELRAMAEKSRAAYRALADEDPDELVIRHPAFGEMSRRDLLGLVHAHAMYHVKRPPFR